MNVLQLRNPVFIRLVKDINIFLVTEFWKFTYIGCSDDGFIDFRAWLIAQGKNMELVNICVDMRIMDNFEHRNIGLQLLHQHRY